MEPNRKRLDFLKQIIADLLNGILSNMEHQLALYVGRNYVEYIYDSQTKDAGDQIGNGFAGFLFFHKGTDEWLYGCSDGNNGFVGKIIFCGHSRYPIDDRREHICA